MATTIYWHDYETFGADSMRDRPCQFAGVRTDADLNIISEPDVFYCAPAEDYLPHPEACFVTGITPQKALSEGVCEAEFSRRIETLFSVPGTCVAGYNSIRFDDEVTRHMFYRNFIDAYKREWANGNSRWDVIDVVRLVHALHPEALNWPKNEAGGVSFRLELLTAENGIEHSAAHDAMSDVYATIELAKLIKSRLPKLFEWAFGSRLKQVVREQFDFNRIKPVFHVSSKFPADLGCLSVMAPLFEHPTNKNGVVCFDLRQDPSIWQDLSVSDIHERLYARVDRSMQPDFVRPGLKTIHLNRCPIVLPASTLRRVSDERQEQWRISEELVRKHLEYITCREDLISKFREVMRVESDLESPTDPDLMLYTGGFFSPSDRAEIERVRVASPLDLADTNFVFQDSRLSEMLVRYQGRNFPESLSEEGASQWEQFKQERLFSNTSGFLTFKEFALKLESLARTADEDQLAILEDLKFYAESIYPYV